MASSTQKRRYYIIIINLTFLVIIVFFFIFQAREGNAKRANARDTSEGRRRRIWLVGHLEMCLVGRNGTSNGVSTGVIFFAPSPVARVSRSTYLFILCMSEKIKKAVPVLQAVFIEQEILWSVCVLKETCFDINRFTTVWDFCLMVSLENFEG